MSPVFFRRRAAVLAALLAALPAPALAWTARTRATIAGEAARLAPPDLARQIEKHRAVYLEAAQAPPAAAAATTADRRLADEVEAAVAAIREHRPFEEIVRRLGAIGARAAEANDPLAAAGGDSLDTARYAADYARYVESAEGRFPLVFYGLRHQLDGARPDLATFSAGARQRAAAFSTSIGLEYRRIGYASGLGRFDDRSTAFAVGSLCFSHAVTDLVSIYRSIWLRAGGADPRGGLQPGARRLLQVTRAGGAR